MFTLKNATPAVALAILASSIAACAMSSPIMEASDGSFIVSARAAPVRGGSTGAQSVAFEEARNFCAKKAARPVLVDGPKERDIYQSSFGGGFDRSGGSFGGGTFAAGASSLHFRCVS
jgi:hypothetical protein